MKIGAYAFHVSGNVQANLLAIEAAVRAAAAQGVRLLLFPECALTGYPPRNLPCAKDADWPAVESAMLRLERLSKENNMCIVVGSITKEGENIRNSTIAFLPGRKAVYHKRALWGWDADNFSPGNEGGVFEFEGLKIGMRICYELRFPEYFRELYRARTDLNLLLFYDVTDGDHPERYDLIRAHIHTRAAENICPVLSANATRPFQTAPVGLYGCDGHPLAELERGKDGLLVYNWQPEPPGFSESGRRHMCDLLTSE